MMSLNSIFLKLNNNLQKSGKILCLLSYIRDSNILKYLIKIMSNLPTKILYFLIVIALFVIVSYEKQLEIKPDIDPPRHNYNQQPLSSYISQKNKTNIFKFPDIAFQISGQFRGLFDSVSQLQMYDKSAYNDNFRQYCDLYWTSTSIKTLGTVPFGQDFEIVKYHLFDRSHDALLYILADNSVLYRYIVKSNQITIDANFTIPSTISEIITRQSQSNIQLLIIKQKLFLFNNQSVYVLHESDGMGTLTKIDGYSPMERLVDTGVAKRNPTNNDSPSISGIQIWVCEQKGIKIYQIVDQNYKISLKLVYQKVNLTQDTILGVFYEEKVSTFYLTTSNNLFAYKLPTNFSPTQGVQQPQTNSYKINGTCRKINKIKQVLYLGCQYERNEYILQLQVQQEDIRINRFYGEIIIEGIRDVESLGFDKIALIGDEEAVIIGEAVNRNVLLELQSKGSSQLKQNIYSFGMIDAFYLPQFSSPDKTVVLSVGFDSLQIIKVLFQSPQIECLFPPQVTGTASILASFNTTHCPYSRGDPNSLGGSYLICETLYPIKLDLKTKQYEEKTANFIFFILMLMAVVLVLLFAGCGVKIRNKANAIIESAQRQISRIQKQRESSQIKKI